MEKAPPSFALSRLLIHSELPPSMPAADQLTLQRILGTVAERNASDLHLTVGSPPVMRIDTKLIPMAEEPVVSSQFIERVVDLILTEEQKAELAAKREVVIAYDFTRNTRFRVDVFYQKGLLAATLRFIGGTVKPLKELGLPPIVEAFTKLVQGIVIVSGPFGSGRTTTLAALVNAINRTRAEYILTIEKPIEYVFVNDKSIVEQREVGRDTPSFEQALASVTDEDVNVVVASEIGSADVVRSILTVAESGRLVLATIGTDSVLRTLEKLVKFFPESEQEQVRLQLASNLQGIICQRLLPQVGGGQVAAAEILVATPPVRAVIKDGMFHQTTNIIQTSREEGMISLDRSLVELIKRGSVGLQDALRYASDKQVVRQLTM